MRHRVTNCSRLILNSQSIVKIVVGRTKIHQITGNVKWTEKAHVRKENSWQSVCQACICTCSDPVRLQRENLWRTTLGSVQMGLQCIRSTPLWVIITVCNISNDTLPKTIHFNVESSRVHTGHLSREGKHRWMRSFKFKGRNWSSVQGREPTLHETIRVQG